MTKLELKERAYNLIENAKKDCPSEINKRKV